MKEFLAFVAIAVGTAALALAISGPPGSAQTPASRTAGTADSAKSPHFGPDFGYAPRSSGSRAAPGYRYPSRGFGSGCSGGRCCPK